MTKSGTNHFHGSVYYAMTNANSMVGRLGGKAYDGFDKNATAGFTFGGPIVKDKLFFFVSYEDQKVSGIKGVGSDAVSTGMLTPQQVADVSNALDAYNPAFGSYGSASAVTLEDKRTLAKLDWNISDSQRASVTFQRTEESKPTPYNSYVKTSSAILPSNWYTSVSKTDNYSVQLFSDWTDSFSTEFKLGYQKYNVNNGAAADLPEVYACFTAVASQCPNYAGNIPASVAWVIGGEDRYRHENSIASKRISGTLSGTYLVGNHAIKGGVDYLSNKTADVFGSLLHGSYGFYDKNNNGTPADEIARGDYGTFALNVLPDGVDASQNAGTWKYTQISPFLQDTWQATDRLSLVYGVRVDLPKSDHAPPVAVENTGVAGVTAGAPVWQTRFGYPSNTALGSKNKLIGRASPSTTRSTRSARRSCGVASACSRPFRPPCGCPTHTSTMASIRRRDSTTPIPPRTPSVRIRTTRTALLRWRPACAAAPQATARSTSSIRTSSCRPHGSSASDSTPSCRGGA